MHINSIDDTTHHLDLSQRAIFYMDILWFLQLSHVSYSEIAAKVLYEPQHRNIDLVLKLIVFVVQLHNCRVDFWSTL